MSVPQLSSLPAGATVVVAMVDLLKEHRLWGWLRIAQGANGLAGVKGLRFAKVMGSGHGGGFSLRPSASHQGLIAVFDSRADAQAFCDGAVFAQYRSHAWQWETPEVFAPDTPADHWEIERAVSLLPERHRTAIRWAYAWPWVPVRAVRQHLGLTRPDLQWMLVDGRDMLVNRMG